MLLVKVNRSTEDSESRIPRGQQRQTQAVWCFIFRYQKLILFTCRRGGAGIIESEGVMEEGLQAGRTNSMEARDVGRSGLEGSDTWTLT